VTRKRNQEAKGKSMTTTTPQQDKATAKGKAAAARETPAAPPVDLTADLQALANPKPYGASGRPVPPEIVKFVEDAHAAWRENPNAWRVVTLSSEAAVGEVFLLARQYAATRSTPLTVQRKKTGDSRELIYRVRSKITQNRRSSAAE
jgi:hypothetical protein